MHELPPGRQPVLTRWHSEAERERIYDDIAGELREGRQAYIVCPLVEESETLDLKAAEATFRRSCARSLQRVPRGPSCTAA